MFYNGPPCLESKIAARLFSRIIQDPIRQGRNDILKIKFRNRNWLNDSVGLPHNLSVVK